MTGPIDYDRISRTYDTHRTGGGQYLRRIIELADETSARHVVELGPGTGNNTQAFLEHHPCALTAVEQSAGMLSQGCAKCANARWLQADATRLPLQGASADFLFSIYMLHHIHDLDALFAECYRVLRGGCAAFLTASRDFIRRHPMNRFFPSFAKVDCARFQSDETLTRAMVRAGFRNVVIERQTAPPVPIDRAYAEKVAGKFISTYDLIPQDEFARGLRYLIQEVERKGRLDTDFHWEGIILRGDR